LDQQASGGKVFKTMCLASGHFQEAQICRPVLCGPPPTVDKAHLSKLADGREVVLFPNAKEYQCVEGYTLDGLASGESKFELTCGKGGLFSSAPTCRPVKCGAPPMVDNSQYIRRNFFFNETVKYTCNPGHTTTGKPGGPTTAEVKCAADGQFAPLAPECKPVECGPPPSINNAAAVGEAPRVVTYASASVNYQCKKGFSTDAADDPYASRSVGISVSCQADGTFTEHEECVNINDCLVAECGDHGTCKDTEPPTGVPLDDYTCECKAGFETTLVPNPGRDGEQQKSCTDINDCPTPEEESCGGVNAGRLRRGDCVDGPQSYSCACNNGYKAGPLPSKPSNQTCLPVVCGSAPEVDYADVSEPGKINFDMPPFTYKCQEGYTLNGQTSGSTSFEVSCQASQQFSTLSECLPVTCGAPLPLTFADKDPATEEMFFGDVVTYTCDKGYSLDSKAGGATSFEVKCGSDGKKSEMKKCSPVECGKAPAHEFATVEDKVYVFGQQAVVTCQEGYSLDGTTSETSVSYELACLDTGSFDEQKKCQPIKCGVAPEVGQTTRDAGENVFGNEVTYQVGKGYSLNGQANGPTEFTINCESDGTFSPTSQPQPVSCGIPVAKKFSSTSGAALVYQEKAKFACMSGYSVDGQPGEGTGFEEECSGAGTFVAHDDCLPVECGTVVLPKNAKQVADAGSGKLASLTFGQKASFECKAGFTLNGRLGGSIKMSTACRADGSQSPHDGCKNADDCAGNQCGAHGKCVDHPNPTGVHKDDYHCDCDSGFDEQILEDGTRVCGNVPDCPQGACMPGFCKDLVNDYKCYCPEGYHEGKNVDKGLDHDCLPNVCGAPPAVEHATTSVTGDVNFASPPVEYKCDEGYTLDGASTGETTFTIECQKDSTFESAPECKPVSCGQLHEVANSQYSAEREWVFPEEGEYKCDTGYSVDGKAAGKKSFKATCTAAGTFDGVQQCLPVACEAIPQQENAKFAESSDMVYPMQTEVTCLPGFSRDPADHSSTTYTVSCNADGTLGYPGQNAKCVAIDCGEAPAVEHAVVEGSTLFGEKLTATAEAGYTLDGSANGAKSFEFRCLKTGEFSARKVFQKVRCGAPPEKAVCS
jgi:CUB/sushi domain-containing protein